MWPAGVGPTGWLFWAAGGALGALEGHGPQLACIFVDSALPAHAEGCSVRVSCSANFLLHMGMRHVCGEFGPKSLLRPLPAWVRGNPVKTLKAVVAHRRALICTSVSRVIMEQVLGALTDMH